MVLTKSELIGALQHEVHILQHLCSKIEPQMLDYRPTEKQRSTIELLKYLAVMGPALTASALAGAFNREDWGARQAAVNTMDFAAIKAALAAQAQEYEHLLANVPDEAFRKEIEMFGGRSSTGAFIVSFVLGGCAAYRTQLFCYLKACGRTELSTANLWMGVDPQPAAV